MPKSEKGSSTSSKKKSSKGGRSSALRNVVASAASTDALIDLVERLGLVDILLGRIKSRLEETDVDELFEEITDYMKRNPEVLVVTLASVTVATGLLVWLNSRREWDGTERRRTAAGTHYDEEEHEVVTAAPGRVRRSA
jgi:hypothetical protein